MPSSILASSTHEHHDKRLAMWRLSSARSSQVFLAVVACGPLPRAPRPGPRSRRTRMPLPPKSVADLVAAPRLLPGMVPASDAMWFDVHCQLRPGTRTCAPLAALPLRNWPLQEHEQETLFMSLPQVLEAIAGVLLVFAILIDVLLSVVVPRRAPRLGRFARLSGFLIPKSWRVWRTIGLRLGS